METDLKFEKSLVQDQCILFVPIICKCVRLINCSTLTRINQISSLKTRRHYSQISQTQVSLCTMIKNNLNPTTIHVLTLNSTSS